MPSALPELLKLECPVQHYPWGRHAPGSLVAALAKVTDPSVPCAELWVGAHPKAPAIVQNLPGRVGLDQVSGHHPQELLGAYAPAEFPFLLKVLSVARPLSIQIHPSREFAAKLHVRDPKNYPDTNHKPEVAIALSPVTLLHGFRGRSQLLEVVNRHVSLASEVGQDRDLESMSVAALREVLLKDIFNLSHEKARVCCHEVYQRTAEEPDELRRLWLIKLAQLYPEGEIGVLVSLLLNLRSVPTGAAIFTPARIPHAYLGGELIECMASSDNVIRVGLTPKFVDVDSLLAHVDFAAEPLDLIEPEIEERDLKVERFRVPVEEFSIERLSGVSGKIDLPGAGRVRVILALSGNVSVQAGETRFDLDAGGALCIPAQTARAVCEIGEGSCVFVSGP